MPFSSLVFLFLFLPAVLAAHALTPRWARNALLLAASLVFYAWGEPRLLGVLLASIAVNYVGGWAVAAASPRWRPVVLGAVVAANLLGLATFKYAGFLVANWNRALVWAGVAPLAIATPALPIGISFFTFQALSYVIDVARGIVPARRSLVDVALYIALFPQLVAGPIIRYHDVAAQLVRRTVGRASFASGVRRFIVGLGKKVLIANTVALPADAIFALPAGDLTPALAWLGVVCYTLQIYFDFSGYSDMAIGLGAMFGFRYPENFDYPYVARSVTEFWRRWHISLSTWLRDYLYVPLGGNRGGARRTYRNLIIVFVLCGLWHGAAWTFVLWGVFHGAFLVLERLGLASWLARCPRVLGHAYLLLVVMVGWVLFRAPTLPEAAAMLAAMVGWSSGAGLEHDALRYLDPPQVLALAAGVVGATPIWRTVGRWRGRLPAPAFGSLAGAEVAVLLVVLVASAARLAAGTYNPFIYFRF